MARIDRYGGEQRLQMQLVQAKKTARLKKRRARNKAVRDANEGRLRGYDGPGGRKAGKR